MSIDTPDTDLATLAAVELKSICGDVVVLPDDPAYDVARMPWNVAAQQYPAAVALPTDADEVAVLVRAARVVGLKVAPQGTGHGASLLADRGLEDALLLRTTNLTQVTVDPVARTARAGGGAWSEHVVDAAAEHGLAFLHGSSPDVGVAGLALGGGIGWYARKHGMACNSITAVELVTAEGHLVRADAEHHADLFWAVRGGGGNFGVVTAFEFALLPITDAYAGRMVWDLADYEKVLRHFNAWAPTAPDDVSTSLRAMRFPPLPFIPEKVRGRQLVIFDGAVLADEARAEEILAGFRALDPELDTWQRTPAPDLVRMHGDPEGPTPAVARGSLVNQLDEETLQAFVAAVGPGAGTSLLMAELRQLGGALRRRVVGAGAFAAMDADFASHFVGIAASPELAARGAVDAERALSALGPAEAVGNYLNLAERRVDPATAFDPGDWARVQRVRAQVDPDGLFLANHPLGG
jgi:FAD/FMN-containing dehydrogenase